MPCQHPVALELRHHGHTDGTLPSDYVCASGSNSTGLNQGRSEGIVPISMQDEVWSLLPVQNMRCVQVGQAVNGALRSCGHNEMAMTCTQLALIAYALTRGTQQQSQDLAASLLRNIDRSERLIAQQNRNVSSVSLTVQMQLRETLRL